LPHTLIVHLQKVASMSVCFVAEYHGEFIECETAEDAAALMTADTLLLSNSANDFTPPALESLAEILNRYGLRDAANSLSQVSARKRAAALLNGDTIKVRNTG
jgi:hypothetical protein